MSWGLISINQIFTFPSSCLDRESEEKPDEIFARCRCLAASFFDEGHQPALLVSSGLLIVN